MIGNNTEKNFDISDYEEFYEHHYFEPIPEKLALSVNEVIPRFGWAYDVIESLNPKTLIDLGCLDGSFALTVAKQLGVSATGIDLTKDGIDLARERAKKFHIDAKFHQGTIEDALEHLAKAGEKFDVVTCFEVIEHVKDVPLLLELIDSVLAPGGSVLVSTPSFEAPTFGLDDEQNKCHIRLYTTKDEDYDKVNKHGTLRHATSITREIGKSRIQEMDIANELINLHYK